MKKLMFAAVSAMLMFCSLTACVKDDLENIDVKIDGDLRTTFSTGSGGSGAYSRARTGISF